MCRYLRHWNSRKISSKKIMQRKERHVGVCTSLTSLPVRVGGWYMHISRTWAFFVAYPLTGQCEKPQ